MTTKCIICNNDTEHSVKDCLSNLIGEIIKESLHVQVIVRAPSELDKRVHVALLWKGNEFDSDSDRG